MDKLSDPYLDAGLYGYIQKVARQNAWRVAGHDASDLVQEALLLYWRCRQKYVGKRPPKLPDDHPARVGGQTKWRYLPPKNPDKTARQHFAALFKTALHNRISTLASKYPPQEIVMSDCTTEHQTAKDFLEAALPTEDETATATLLLKNAPRELKQLFAVLVDDVVDLPYRRFGKRGLRKRETNNQYYCRLLGLPASTDIVGMLEEHFCLA